MNSNDIEESVLSPRSIEDIDSPRKRLRLDNNCPKKSWSLIDKKADPEVLQEMGVSILDPDDGDSGDSLQMQMHKPLKRKHSVDIENVNPNVDSGSPRRPRLSPKRRSPKRSPSPGPSKGKTPRSADKSKPLQQLQPSDQNLLETTFLEEYLIEQETPLAQSVSAKEYGFGAVQARNRITTPLGLQEELILSRRPKSEPQGIDAFAALSDEMLLSVFRWLPKRTLAHCMLVCKRWHRVAYDETLWQRLDLGNKSLSQDALGRVLARKPNIVRLANSEIGSWHPTSPEPSRIQYLDLSMAAIDLQTLDCLLARCPLLRKLSLESVLLGDTTCMHIGKCTNLETLNLTMAQGITAQGLALILRGCTSIQALNISWCSLSEEALHILVNELPARIQRLNLGGGRMVTNDMIKSLVARCPRLVELDLSDCCLLEAAGVAHLQGLTRLQHLGLSRCYALPPACLTKLSCMPSLQYLEVWGMLQTASLNALKAALPAIQINRFMFSAIARPTVGTRRTSIWGLRTRD